MKGAKIVLDKVHIENFLSLHDVELPIKPMTILVGPNASGKSNVLKALKLLKEMILEGPPTIREAQSMFWAGVANSINFQLQAHLEWNLHPGLFIELGRLLKKLSQRTQVIIITYSSQLLDIFNAEDLADSLGILLLHNEPGEGTRVINLEKVQQDREAVKDWMEEFGLGSAIFESQLLGETVLVQHFGKSLARYNS